MNEVLEMASDWEVNRKEKKRKKEQVREKRATQKVDKGFTHPVPPLAIALLSRKSWSNTDSHTYFEKAQFYS